MAGFQPLPEDMGLFGLDGGVRLWLSWSKLPTHDQLVKPDVSMEGRRLPVRRVVSVEAEQDLTRRLPITRKATEVPEFLGADDAASPSKLTMAQLERSSHGGVMLKGVQ